MIIALGEGGLDVAAVMLVVVVASNLLLENFVEPRVMGRTLDIHPLVVLVVTALGGFLFGIVGLILAVPFTVIAGNAVGRLRAKGFLELWPTGPSRPSRRCSNDDARGDEARTEAGQGRGPRRHSAWSRDRDRLCDDRDHVRVRPGDDGRRPRELSVAWISALVGDPDDHHRRVRRQRSDNGRRTNSSPRS